MFSWDDARQQAAALAPVPGWVEGALSDQWVVPPFSILNTNLGAWQNRRRYWLAMGIQPELGRDGDVLFAANAQQHLNDTMGYSFHGTSLFDPVLTELMYRWFAPPGGQILDPFAGGSVRGVVAGYLGHPYIGIDLSRRQIEANREQAKVILQPDKPVPYYIVGDSRQVLETYGEDDDYDLILTCPPYFDLEVYSDDPHDLSAQPTYGLFLEAYQDIILKACRGLRKDRFAVIVVSEVRSHRDPRGGYVGLVPDTIRAFETAGLAYYNEIILVNVVGTLPVRAGRQFTAGRKVGKMHQNILVFLKGDVPRDWSASRDQPPDPQQTLF